jgi:hypothetical protein
LGVPGLWVIDSIEWAEIDRTETDRMMNRKEIVG